MDYEQFENKNLTSSHHLTVSQNIELRRLLNECNRLRVLGNLVKWKFTLDAILSELNHDMEKLDDKNKGKDVKLCSQVNIIIDKLKKANQKNKQNCYELLQEYEKLLRKIQELSGKGTKRVYDDEDDDD
jgi:hypothetical protein